MLATCTSSALQGIEAALVHVEVNAGETGDPKLLILLVILSLLQLPDASDGNRAIVRVRGK